MADDKHYVAGEFYRIDDMTGFKVRNTRTKKMWTGTIRRTQSWEPRNAQDLVRGVIDYQSVPEPRPRQVNVFIGVLGTVVTVFAPIAATTVQVESSIRMLPGDVVTVMLDNGINFRTNILTVPTSTSIQVTDPLPWTASVQNPVDDITAYSSPNINT